MATRYGRAGWVGFVAMAGMIGTLGATEGVWTNRASGAWSVAANWRDGVAPGSGGAAAFEAASGTYDVTNDVGTIALSRLTANAAAGNGATWQLRGGVFQMVAPRVITTGGGMLDLNPTTLAADGDVVFAGPGRFFLGVDNPINGRAIISNGNVRARLDSGFGPVPATLRPDAILLDGGGLMNDAANLIYTNPPTRGITLTERGGFLGAGYAAAGVRIEAPITGPGRLGINFENNFVTLANSANSYDGDTAVGTVGPGANPGLAARLRLGVDETLPHGAGKGGLHIVSDSSHNNALPAGILDLNGRAETVNTLHGGTKAQIENSVPGQGRLIIGSLGGASDYRGALATGVTIEKRGSGDFIVRGARLGSGVLEMKDGTLVTGGPNLDGARVLLDGGNILLTRPSGLHEFRAPGATVDLNAALTYMGWMVWPEKGSTVSTALFPNNTQFVYRGLWHVPEAGVYSFAKGFDDGGYLAINGQTILLNHAVGDRAVAHDVAIAAGWHTIEIRYTQGGSAVGPQFGFRNGILYDAGNGGFTNAAELARARMFTDDGGPALLADGFDNVLSGRLVLARNATLTVAANAGLAVFGGVLTTNAPAAPEPTLTIENQGAPLRFGAPGATPAVLDAAVTSAGGLLFTNRVWLRRQPGGAHTIAANAELTLDAPAALGNNALTLTAYDVRLVRPDSVGGDGSVTVRTGRTLGFDTQRFVGGALSDSPAHTLAVANAVTLEGGAVRFAGAGTTTYSGALTGVGNVIKEGGGDLLLTGSASMWTGEIRIDAGRLLPANEAALGGASLRLNGGRLVNPINSDLTLAFTPIIAQSGGFEVVGAGRILTANGTVTGTGPVSKWGAGALALGGSSPNNNLDLHVREGSVDLAKTGAEAHTAVRHLAGIEPGAVVRLAGAHNNQIGGNVTLSGGIFDLHGRSETIGILTNTLAGGLVTNSAATMATLTVGAGDVSSAFNGALSDGVGALRLVKTGVGALTMPLAAMRRRGGTLVEAGTLRVTASLPVTAGLVYRLDATDSARLTLTPDARVSAWADSTANGYLFAQADPAQRPHYVTNAINGLPAVRFGVGGVSSRLVANTSAVARTVFIVSQMLAHQGLAGVWGEAGQDRGLRHANATSWRHTGNFADGNDFTMNGEMRINGVAGFSWGAQPLHILSAVSATDRTWVNAIGNYWAGTGHGATRFLNGWIGEILVYNRTLTVAERQAVEEHLAGKWFGGVALPATQPIAVAAGAHLALRDGNMTLVSLTGAGVVMPETGNIVTLQDYGGFVGTVAGTGTISLQSAVGGDVAIVPQSFGVTVRNDGAQRVNLRVNTQTEQVFIGSARDGSNILGIVHSGPGTTIFGGASSAYTGATLIENGAAIVGNAVSAKFVRFQPQTMRSSGAHINTGYQISEFHLTLNGQKAEYPVGTLATSPGRGPGAEGPERAIDGRLDTKFYISVVSPVHPLIIELPHAMQFDGYRWHTANDAEGRDPVAWNVSISHDGVNWTLVDQQDYFNNQGAITWARQTLAGSWLFSARTEMDVFSNLSATMVAAPGQLGVSSVRETIGALSGNGAIRLINRGALGINAFANAAFVGNFTGTGTVVKTGARTQALSGALGFVGDLIVEAGVLDLSGAALNGVTSIVVRAGATLAGAATAQGPVAVTFENGSRFSGSLAVSGALTVRGPIGLALPDPVVYPYQNTFFSYASADSATLAALAAAVRPAPIPVGHAATVRVTPTSARLIVAPVGTIMSLR